MPEGRRPKLEPLHLALSPKTCAFKLSDDANCPETKLLAKGYCSPHYFQLRRAGAFADLPQKQRTPAATLAANVRAQRRAQRKLENLAPKFVDHLYAASTVASAKGDATPAQWALLHARAIQPLQTQSQNNNALTVNVGVKVEKDSKGDGE